TFDDCFEDLYELLLNDQLVELALHKLSNPSKWVNPHKSKDMINAFSEVYNEIFFEGATFDVLYNGSSSHLTDVIFGSSEFTFGIQFRFQEEKGQGKFGNGHLNVPQAATRNIRIADAVAASSCFPGGFEPMIMPVDFGNGPDSDLDKVWTSQKDYQKTAIMDGGIIDNLGIEGVRLAEQRHSSAEQPFIGTYIVSDVSSDMMTPYEVPILEDGGIKNFITINGINNFAAIFMIAAVALLVFAPMSRLLTIALSSFLPLIVIWFLVYFYAKAQLSTAIKQNFGADQLQELLKDFRILIKTPVYILVYLIKFRLTSVLKMVSDVFLRRIRRLSLEALYRSNDWNYRFKSNYIYTLQKNDQQLTEAMKRITKVANNMPTTLWFTEKEFEDKVLNDLIACGQFTQCRNLLRYLERVMTGTYKEKVWDTLTAEYQDDLIELNARILLDWEQFKLDPYWLLNKQLSGKKGEIA
ncbi:MAG: hypothetical protein ACI9P5_000756, partial [Saprospiraceae bacterium]